MVIVLCKWQVWIIKVSIKDLDFVWFFKTKGVVSYKILKYQTYYRQTSMAQTPLEPRKHVRDWGISS